MFYFLTKNKSIILQPQTKPQQCLNLISHWQKVSFTIWRHILQLSIKHWMKGKYLVINAEENAGDKIQYRHLIPAPVDRTSSSAWLYKHSLVTCWKNKPRTAMNLVACESKLHSVVRSSVHPCPGNWVAIRRTVLYFARAAHAFSTQIKCWHCICHKNKAKLFSTSHLTF